MSNKHRNMRLQARAAPWLEVNPGSHEGGQAASRKQQAAQKRFDNEA